MKVLLFHNCTILTVDENDSIAEAMGVVGDKILAVGTKKEVQSDITKFKETSNEDVDFKEIDLNGACVVPGFIDAHMHPLLSIIFKTQIMLSEVRSYAELEEVLKREDKKRDAGEWILGMDLMEDMFDDPTEHHFPDRYDLDPICPDRPVVILRYDGHICSVNSAALKIIGMDSSNVEEFVPTSGEIRLDADGTPTGIFTEGATSYAIEHVSIPTADRLETACKTVSEELASYGITTCGVFVQLGEIGIAGKAGAVELPILQYFIKKGLIEQDYVFYLVTNRPKKLLRYKKSIPKLAEEENRFVVGGIKIFADGSLGAHTACMSEPFTDSPGTSGLMVIEKEELYRLFKETNDLGLQIACHAIGDKANQTVVETYREVLSDQKQQDMRHRIEHASLISEACLKTAAKLGIIMVSQPAFIDSEYQWIEHRLGSRIKQLYAFRSIIDSGCVLAGASDAPIEPASALKAFRAAVTRNGFVPEQAITVIEALKMYTWNAAYALGQESMKGSLEEGKLADFVVLEDDIRTVQVDKLASIRVLATYHRGKRIYSAK